MGRPSASREARQAQRGELVRRCGALFFRRGPGLSVDAMASCLGLSKKTIYGAFESKGRLLEAILESEVARFDAGIGERLALGRDFDDRLERLFAYILEFLGRVTPAFILELRRRYPKQWEKALHARNGVLRRHLTPLFEEGAANGWIGHGLETRFLVDFFVHAVPQLIQPGLFASQGAGSTEPIRQFQSMILRGITAEVEKEKAARTPP